MFSFFYTFLYLKYTNVFYFFYIKVPLWNFFIYSIRFLFVALYRDLTVWNLGAFIKRFFDYFIGAIYYTAMIERFKYLNTESLLFFLLSRISSYINFIMGFTWTSIHLLDIPEKIEMLVSLYIYILMLDIVSDSYILYFKNFSTSNFFFENFLIIGCNDEFFIIVLDIIFILINSFFLIESNIFFIDR